MENENIKSKNKNNLSAVKNYSSPLNDNAPEFDMKNKNNKTYLGESSLAQFINDSLYDEIKYQYEAKEILNGLRSKYLPNSIRKNSFNNSMKVSQNMTYFNTNNNIKNQYFSYTEYYNSPKVKTEKLDYYKSQKLQNSFLDNKEITNINETIKSNNQSMKNFNLNLKNSNSNDISILKNENKNSRLNNYLKEENERLKIINKNYELLIKAFIEYINDINYYFGHNIIDFHIINEISKQKDLSIDNKSLNDLKSLLKYTKNNIMNSNKNEKMNYDKNSNIKDLFNKNKIKIEKKQLFNVKEKEDTDKYKPIIFDNRNKNFEKEMFKSSDFGSIKRARTVKERLPISFWLQNKRVKFKD